MKLDHRFDLPVAADDAFGVLTDVERIAPCMPGAQLQEIEGDEYRGVVKIKVGPILASYKGTATFVERDDAGRRAVIRASGRDIRGQGNANATIILAVAERDGGSSVDVSTDLSITGRVAQLGRGAISEVSAKLLDQFVDSLQMVVDTSPPPTRTDERHGETQDAPAVRTVNQPEPEPVELVAAAGPALLKRVLPIAVVVVLLLVVRRRGRRRSS